ncbi:hypothetical protein G7054_g1655 [Neopestalotiopsis clavispora]|nr:hypothetical protein G7054_g1655 [Neopestalotiopsis clavispora]
MLFFSFFKTLIDNEVTVELKNDIQIRGTLKSVDQYLNIKLDEISVVDEIKYPHLVRLYSFLTFSFRRRFPSLLQGTPRTNMSFFPSFSQSSVKNVFIRGSVVRYVHLPHNAVDVTLLEDATRRGKFF